MEEVSVVGVDLAKQVFQVHGAAADGRVLFRKTLSRLQVPKFMPALSPCSRDGGLRHSPLLGARVGKARP